MRLVLAATLVAAVALGACGGGSKDLVSDDATNVLKAHVSEIRLAAAAADANRIRAEVAELRGVVGQLRNQGKLSEDGAVAILAEAARVEESAALVTPTTRPTTAPIVTEPRDEDKSEDDGGRNGRGDSNGKGKRGDD